jgi:4,5:9,10-diseco-3-hydroxy-5,9,17-trioxoandrosta-1(10),2-diene-4-oate hydrolase
MPFYMTTESKHMPTPQDRFVTVDGSTIRYIEQGKGPPIVFLHGASLGSSADVFIRNLSAFANSGFRALAYDQPGFGLSDIPQDHSVGFRRKNLPAFCKALGLERPALVAHSQAGNMAVQLALETPDAWSHVVILGTGSLLPALEASGEGREAVVQARLERRMATEEPSIEDTRKLLEANLFHHELITPDELALRHSRSLGKAFEAFVARSQQTSNKTKGTGDEAPMWKRLLEIRVPLLLLYGRNDRANAFERATKLKALAVQLDLHIVPDCKHLVPWDAEKDVARLAIPFLKA